MIAYSTPLIGLSALIAVGLVAANDMAGLNGPSAAANVAARFPQSHEMFVPLGAGRASEPGSAVNKGDKVPANAGTCTREHWPYIADECLVATDGAPVRRPTRTITIERRIGDNTSQLVRVNTTDVASR